MTDFLFGPDGDLLFNDGDLVVGESVVQHQKDIILLDKGHNVYAPTMGVGAVRYILDYDPPQFVANCKLELKRDGLPNMTTGEITQLVVFSS